MRYLKAPLIHALIAGVALAVASSAHASIWTPLESGTTDEISAIEYQTPTRFWFATTNGRIYSRRPNGSLAQELSAPGVVFNDIAAQRDGGVVLAVGNDGEIWRSFDDGRSFRRVTGLPSIPAGGCPGNGPGRPFGHAYSVAFASDSRVYVTGSDFAILRSDDAGSTFREVNKRSSVSCRVGQGDAGTAVTDAEFLNEDVGYFIGASFPAHYKTADGLTGVSPGRGQALGAVSGSYPRLALDRTNPTRQWVAGRCGGCLSYTTTEGLTWSPASYPNGGRVGFLRPYDIEYSWGTVLAAGDGGQIVTSLDGVHFWFQPADGALENADWHAVDLADAARGAVGGPHGKLAITDLAYTLPDTVAPRGRITGPDAGAVGEQLRFTAELSDDVMLDPARVTWFVNGTAAENGPTYNPRFDTSGTYALRVTFRDAARNTGSADRSLRIAARSTVNPPVELPPITVPRATAKLSATTARARRAPHRRVRLLVSGVLHSPSPDGCTGRVTATWNAGRRIGSSPRAARRLTGAAASPSQ